MHDRFYVICSTPRTGSSLICDLLGQTGRHGKPDEYFEHRLFERAPFLSESGIGNFDEVWRDPNRYLALIARRFSTPNGMAGIKLHCHHFLRLRAAGFDPLAALDSARFVYCTRGDILAQAISAEKAVQRGSWNSEIPATGSLAFDPLAIRTHMWRIVEHGRIWEDAFQAARLQPLRMSFEELVAAPKPALEEICRFLGEDSEIAAPRLRPQSEDVDKAWKKAFRAWLKDNHRAQVPADILRD